MLLTELWDDIMKQREDAAVGTQPTNSTKKPMKPLTAKERQEQRKADIEAKRQKQKDAMKQRSQHNGNRREDDSEDE